MISASRSSRAADEDLDDPESAVLRPDPPVQDPGDREEPLTPEQGSPWDASITEDRRAARLEGRRLVISNANGDLVGESFYRIDRFRRFIPRRGSDGRGLIQFWGPRATRQYRVGREPVPDWTVVSERKLNTVMVGEILSLK